MNIDTLSIARDLKATELPAAQAKAIAAAIRRPVTDGAATRADVELARSGIETKIEQVRTDAERIRNQLLIGFVSTQVALAGIIIAIVIL